MKYKCLNILIFLLILIKIYSFPQPRNLEPNSDKEIQNGIYLIQSLEGHLNLKLINSSLYFSSRETKNKLDKFHFHKKGVIKENEYDNYDEDSEIYYYIEEKNSRKKLYFDDNTESVLGSETINPEEDDKFLWEIELMNYRNNMYYYQLKSKLKKKYISYEETNKEISKAYCESSWKSLSENRNIRLRLIKLYKENENINKESDLLEKEPIDVVIKYIDINDTSLKRENLEQVKKDEQNNELKYSLRSILQNIPWVRKIFIIMPNENIPYLKEKREIQEKIVYIKDSDILGYDSSSPPTIQFNLHKMKKYDLSENFILMDDDYFIGQPLSKSDLFYEEKGKIYPYLISTEYSELDEDEVKTEYISSLSGLNYINYHSKDGFKFRKIATLLFLYKIFDTKKNLEPLIEVGYTHNAIPLKISDVEEVYELIENKYQYNEVCLRGNRRNIRTLQPQILFMNYARNKYDRAVREISWKYYDLSDVRDVHLDSKLFVINVEEKDYYPLRFKAEEEVLSSLFPNPIIYEKEYVNKNENINIKKDEKNENIKSDDNSENIDINEIFNKIQRLNNETKVKIEEKKDDKKIEEKEKKKEETKKEEKTKEDDEKKGEKDEQKIEKKEEKKEDEKEEQKKEQKPEQKDKPVTNNENDKENKNKITVEKDIPSKQNNNDSTNEKLYQEIKNELKNNKEEFEKKYNQILEELSNIKTNLKKPPQENPLLTEKLKELNEAQTEIKKKISSIESDNSNIKQAQIELGEKLSALESDVENKEELKSLKDLYDHLYEENGRIKDKIKDLSDENNSLNNKLSDMNNKNENKDTKIKDLIEENDEMKKKIKNYENEIDEWKKKVENMENEQLNNKNQNQKNEEQINRLNYEIVQLKETLNQLKEKKEETKNYFDENMSLMKYLIIIAIIIVAIYLVYAYCKNEDDSGNVKHMKLSQQYSGYGGFSNNLM